MSPPPPASRGRPLASSREMLQDAAFELFLERGYAGTTVDHITQRVGVSRNTFFNYFPAKSDVFWVELDETLETLTAALHEASADVSPMTAVSDAVLACGRQFGPTRVPFALTQHALIGSVHELQASALIRFTRQAAIIRDFLLRRDIPYLHAQAGAYAVIVAGIAAAQSWGAAGTSRGELTPYLRAALSPIVAGYDALPKRSFDDGVHFAAVH
ncbi:MAG: hypothetical protein JWP30_2076 [Homoserinimonas sp.]|nr:hypothetical protein [Homoserinimonas sp.]